VLGSAHAHVTRAPATEAHGRAFVDELRRRSIEERLSGAWNGAPDSGVALAEAGVVVGVYLEDVEALRRKRAVIRPELVRIPPAPTSNPPVCFSVESIA
jgi:hypothetical protein